MRSVITSFTSQGLAGETHINLRAKRAAASRPACAMLAFMFLSGRGHKTSVSLSPDASPPGVVCDLSSSTSTDSSIVLKWIAPGDDRASGTAAEYDIRYATSPGSLVTPGGWEAATRIPAAPAPQPAGTPQQLTVTGLSPRTIYYFALVVSDEAGNASGLSNVDGARTYERVPTLNLQWGVSATANGQFGTPGPTGIAIDRARNVVYVADPEIV